MTSSMYIEMAELLDGAAKDDQIRVVLWHAAGDSFSAGNDLEDFMKNPPASGESPQSRLMHALINFDEDALSITVEDLNSSNGTYVNRERVYPGQPRQLFVNDTIQIGTVHLTLKV